jgi:predicted nuclease of predicted toxin-antitoxin system
MDTARRRVLLDNCVPRRLAALIEGHTVASVVDLGWGNLKDAELLDRMAGRYDVLITVDRGIRHQQRVRGRSFSIVVLRARTNRLVDLLLLVPPLLQILKAVKAGAVHEIGRVRRGDSPSAH